MVWVMLEVDIALMPCNAKWLNMGKDVLNQDWVMPRVDLQFVNVLLAILRRNGMKLSV